MNVHFAADNQLLSPCAEQVTQTKSAGNTWVLQTLYSIWTFASEKKKKGTTRTFHTCLVEIQ